MKNTNNTCDSKDNILAKINDINNKMSDIYSDLCDVTTFNSGYKAQYGDRYFDMFSHRQEKDKELMVINYCAGSDRDLLFDLENHINEFIQKRRKAELDMLTFSKVKLEIEFSRLVIDELQNGESDIFKKGYH